MVFLALQQSCVCVFVFLFVYLTVGNISFDVLGPWAFKKYSIIRIYKVFSAWWRQTNDNQVNLEQVSSLNIEQSRLLQYKKYDKHAKCVQNANIHDRYAIFATFTKFGNWRKYKLQNMQRLQNLQNMQNSQKMQTKCKMGNYAKYAKYSKHSHIKNIHKIPQIFQMCKICIKCKILKFWKLCKIRQLSKFKFVNLNFVDFGHDLKKE